MTKPRDVLCVDCGEWFVLVGADPDQTYDRCGPCQWLHETTDPAERERIRALTHRRDMT